MYPPRSSSLSRALNSPSSGFRPMLRAAPHTDAARVPCIRICTRMCFNIRKAFSLILPKSYATKSGAVRPPERLGHRSGPPPPLPCCSSAVSRDPRASEGASSCGIRSVRFSRMPSLRSSSRRPDERRSGSVRPPHRVRERPFVAAWRPRDKDARHMIWFQVYERILALGILVRVLVDEIAVFHQLYVKLLSSKVHDVAVGEHDGNVLHQSSLASSLTACILPFTRPSVRRLTRQPEQAGSREPTASHVSWEFIGGSSPTATVEGARRPLQGACTANPALRPPGSSCGPSSAAKRVTSGRRKTEAAVEALLGSLDHKCTLVHLAPGGQLCLGYTKEGGRLHANPGTWRG